MPRYIDADVMIGNVHIGDYLDVKVDGKILKEWVKAQPTVDVAPVIHSHWKEYEDYSGAVYPECAHCGLVWWLDEGTAEENEMYYCPRCGAKMDEKEGQ